MVCSVTPPPVGQQRGLGIAFDEVYGAVLAAQARRDRLDTAIGELAATPPWAPLVGRLGCLRGVGVLTALGLAVEIGDWQRFTGATIGAYLGLVPTEHSSGLQRVQGSITKTGNSHARRLLVEGACHHASLIGWAGSCNAARPVSPLWSGSGPSLATAGSTSAGVGWTLGASAPRSAWSRSPASSPDGAGAWPSWTPDPAGELAGGRHPPARGATRDTPMSSQAIHTAGDARSLDQRTAPDAHLIMQ
jgi:hypothetical protein